LSASLPTSPSQQLSTSTLSDYCVDFLFDGVLTQNLENTAISVPTFKPKRCKRFHFPVFLLANIRGGFASKLDEFQVLFNENNIDIAVLTETWLHSDITSDMLYIPGYTLFRLDRHDGRQGGGVAIYVKSTTDCSLLPDQSQHNFEVLWLVYRANYMPRELTHFLVGAIYHPPKANNYDLTDYLITTMDQVTRSHPNAGTVLLGDFNQLPDSLLKSYPLQQVVTSSTRGKSVLDKIFTSVSSWYQAPLILPAVSRSDHETILFQPAENPLRPSKSVTHTYRGITSHNRRALLFNDLQQHNWSHFYHLNCCQDMVDYFYSFILYLLDLYMPVIRSSVNNLDKPWVTPEFRHLIRQRQRAFMSSQKPLYCKLRNKVQRLAASLRKQYYSKKIEQLHSADSRSWWKKTKQFLHLKQTDTFVLLEQSNPVLNGSLAETINNFFVSVSAHLPPFDSSVIHGIQPDLPAQYIIDPIHVEYRLTQINIHKSPGPDGLPNWLLRDLAPLLSQPLAAIFNASLRQGYLPPIWKSAEVVPVPKIHPPISIHDDLRPISLLPTVAKVFESIVGNWFLSFIEPYLDSCQFGCRKSRSTTHALVAILHTWMSALDSHGSVRSIFVDFRKAFDLVDHNILFTKLLKYNIPNFLLIWFSSYLSNRQQRVRVKNSVSTFRKLNGAMPQGSWLGPLAFLVLIDDLCTGCPLHKYVDDTTLSELVQPKQPDTHMSTYLAHLLTWAAHNGMEINTSKTKEMLLGPLASINLPLLTISSQTIERVTSFKLLGVHLDSSLAWSTHINHIIKKATTRLYFLKQLKRAGLSSSHLLHFYITVIRPVLEYCAPLWHYALTKAQSESLEAVQKRAIRIVHIPTHGMPYSSMLFYANLSSLASRREDLSYKFFCHIADPASCLHSLLPPPRPSAVTSRLRSSQMFPKVHTRTKRYCSFIQYGLNHYQHKMK